MGLRWNNVLLITLTERPHGPFRTQNLTDEGKKKIFSIVPEKQQQQKDLKYDTIQVQMSWNKEGFFAYQLLINGQH